MGSYCELYNKSESKSTKYIKYKFENDKNHKNGQKRKPYWQIIGKIKQITMFQSVYIVRKYKKGLNNSEKRIIIKL